MQCKFGYTQPVGLQKFDVLCFQTFCRSYEILAPSFFPILSINISFYLAEIAEQRKFDMHKKGKSIAISTKKKKKTEKSLSMKPEYRFLFDPLLCTSNTKQSLQ